jgi:hypothetical protein
MARQFIFKHYWLLAIVVGGVFVGLAYAFGGNGRAGLIGAAIAGALGFCYFVQQQKLAETQLFHQLFTAFNYRYNQLNGPLAIIASQEEAISPAQLGLIVDYFNLCAEEYLFYSEGYIHRDVWRSWCRGMAWYLKRHPFRDVWNEEFKTESFYGLSLEAILEGAA